MTTTAERQFTVGQQIRSAEEWQTIPVGTTLTGLGADDWSVEMHEGQRYLCRGGSPLHQIETTRTDGGLTIVSLPRPEPGTRITSREMYQALPIGATIRTAGGAIWTKVDAETLSSNSSGRRRLVMDFSTTNGNTISSYPDDPPAVFSMEGEGGEGVECSLADETLMQYKQRFETILWGLTQNHGVSDRATAAAMARLRVPDSTADIRPGMVVYFCDNRLVQALPVGTMLQWGPDEAPAVWEKRVTGAYITHLLGREDVWSGHLITIKAVPGVEPVDWAADAVENENQRITEFMRQAWDVGQRVKQEQSWCGTFESCMLRVGISHRLLRNREQANSGALTTEQVAALPPGSIVRLARADESVLFIRDDAMTNPARTRRVAGTVEGDWTRQSVVQVHDVTSPTVSIPALSHGEMDVMPLGTAIGYSSERPERWAVMNEEGRWRQSGTYSYRSTDLDVNSCRYTGFPFAVPVRGGLSRTS